MTVRIRLGKWKDTPNEKGFWKQEFDALTGLAKRGLLAPDNTFCEPFSRRQLRRWVDDLSGDFMKIELRGVIKSYRSVKALDRVSLEIGPGQIVGLLGSNGAGKTTLLRCLSGLSSPDEGSVTMDEQEFHRDRTDLRQRMYLMPDFPFLFWDQPAIRNIAIILKLYGADGPGAEERVVGLLREFDMLPLAFKPVGMLSRGQLYKAGLVAMIAADREVWLMDEPFASGMDPHGIDSFKRHARAASSRGSTIIYSTQLLDVAERFSDRVCVIHKGEVRAFDTLDRLRETAADKDNVLDGIFRQLREEGR
ncbi:MAG TPA: ABC transporter ATP-binding protein [Roseimicrobium sp.]|nr:ABC transporter ATP-binding protein [Roseimicrobium sp.]